MACYSIDRAYSNCRNKLDGAGVSDEVDEVKDKRALLLQKYKQRRQLLAVAV
jgi:hypothetical protein